jgi:hypothetical protein
VEQVATANEEAIRAWDGPLFDAFVRFRHLMTTGLGVHGEEALRLVPPRGGDGLADWAGPDGVIAPASTWIVTASAPL